MNKWKVILTSAVFLAGCQFFPSQQVCAGGSAVSDNRRSARGDWAAVSAVAADGSAGAAASGGLSAAVDSGAVAEPDAGIDFRSARGCRRCRGSDDRASAGAMVTPQPGPPGSPAVVAGPPNPIMVPVGDENWHGTRSPMSWTITSRLRVSSEFDARARLGRKAASRPLR